MVVRFVMVCARDGGAAARWTAAPSCSGSNRSGFDPLFVSRVSIRSLLVDVPGQAGGRCATLIGVAGRGGQFHTDGEVPVCAAGQATREGERAGGSERGERLRVVAEVAR